MVKGRIEELRGFSLRYMEYFSNKSSSVKEWQQGRKVAIIAMMYLNSECNSVAE